MHAVLFLALKIYRGLGQNVKGFYYKLWCCKLVEL